jgi:excinuclease ABC subunit A
MDTIEIRQAKTHNLKNVSLTLPRQKMIVFTGVSGSGKSSLVFDTLYAEGQRRFLESLNSYAQQYVTPMEKPDVEAIHGLSPAIAIDQKTASFSPRSTVGTISEVTDYLRVLYARLGTPYCPDCQVAITPQTLPQMEQRIESLPEQSRLQILAPVVRGRKGDYHALLQTLRKEGFSRVRLDGEFHLLEDLPEDYRLERYKIHHIEVVIERLVWKPTDAVRARLHKALPLALQKGGGFLTLHWEEPESSSSSSSSSKAPKEALLSQHLACPGCDQNFGEMAPRLFSFNSPYGACPSCQGMGVVQRLQWQRCLDENPELSLEEEALVALRRVTGSKYYRSTLRSLAKRFGFKPSAKPGDLPCDIVQQLVQGEGTHEPKAKKASGKTALSLQSLLEDSPSSSSSGHDDEFDISTFLEPEIFPGLEFILQQRWQSASSPSLKRYLGSLFEAEPCIACEGTRLNRFARSVQLSGRTFEALHQCSIQDCRAWLSNLSVDWDDRQRQIGQSALQEVTHRLAFIENVGLNYLHLGRQATTLSGGEAQRIRLAGQIGAKLSGVLYVLDEPSIGLHPYNTEQLIETLKQLRDQGNTLLVVEHEEAIIRAADHVVDVGPEAGVHGGEILFSASAEALIAQQQDPSEGKSQTWPFLVGKAEIRRTSPVKKTDALNGLRLENVSLHNLQHLATQFKVGALNVVTGPSGSGKSTLVMDCLRPLVERKLQETARQRKDATPLAPLDPDQGDLPDLAGIKRLIAMDQTPIGKNRRSNPATYTGLYDEIRALYAKTELSQIRGYESKHFSFNVKGGRCDHCQGEGSTSIEVGFFPKVEQVCGFCGGQRFKPEILDVQYEGKTILDVLTMPIEEAVTFFEAYPSLQRKLSVLNELGLGYLALGQPSPQLSGGEAQRLKLATELLNPSTSPTLYLLDEPTIGLHWRDVDRLIQTLYKLTELGHTLIVVEHNLDIIRHADWVIELGPGGGEQGGRLVYEGTLKTLLKQKHTLTGQYL